MGNKDERKKLYEIETEKRITFEISWGGNFFGSWGKLLVGLMT